MLDLVIFGKLLAPSVVAPLVSALVLAACHEIFPFAKTLVDARTGDGRPDRHLTDGPPEVQPDLSPPTDEGGDAPCPWGPFSAPALLPGVSSSEDEWSPWLTADGLHLYFSSWRRGGLGASDLWRADRATPDSTFNIPAPAEAFNSPDSEACVSFTADGLFAVFARQVRDDSDIWFATRSTPYAPFEAPRLLAGFGTSVWDGCPRISPDGLRMLFMTGRGGRWGDIWVASRSTRDEDFAEPTVFAATDSPSTELSAVLSEDELELYFDSERDGGSGGLDLWVARRPAPAADFGPPTPLEELNTSNDDVFPALSADGSALYFNRDTIVEGGVSSLRSNLWVATRRRECGR